MARKLKAVIEQLALVGEPSFLVAELKEAYASANKEFHGRVMDEYSYDGWWYQKIFDDVMGEQED